MPRIQVHERGDEVKPKGSCHSNEDDTRTIGREESPEEFVGPLIGFDLFLSFPCESSNNQEQREHYQVQLNDAEDDKGGDVGPSRSRLIMNGRSSTGDDFDLPFRPISQGKNKLQ